MSDKSDGFSLVMPFVATESHGGPFDDDAYVAGWEAGQVWARLEVAAVVGAATVEPRSVVRCRNLDQLDLVAMHFGYRMAFDHVDEHDEWAYVTFTRDDDTEG